jgi:hypothetical protein
MKKFPIGSGLSIEFQDTSNVVIIDDDPDYCYLLQINNRGLLLYLDIYHDNYGLDEGGALKIIGVDEI